MFGRETSRRWLFCVAMISQFSTQLIAQGAPPEILRISPTSGTEGSSVAIAGTNLQDATGVFFGATSAAFKLISPEELIIDFGLNPQPMGVPTKPIAVVQRIIVNYFTAKRLLAALSMSVQRHESVFGVLETDVQKRLKQQPR